MITGDGRRTDFWGDVWFGEIHLMEKFLSLFDICNYQIMTVAGMAERRWRTTFRRWLDPYLQNEYRLLQGMLVCTAVLGGVDRQKWK
jgi:hypothetical protein